jgi:hypothetical protein
MRKFMWVLLGVSIAATAYSLPNTVLRLDAIQSVKEAVRSEFRTQKGIVLTKVDFVRKNDNELQGFAAFDMGLRKVVKTCIANREDRSSRYLWNCY